MPKKHKYTNLFDKVVDMKNIYDAYKQVMKGNNKYCDDAIKFYRDETYNLHSLRNILIKNEYSFGNYTKFYVYEPKERLIYAPTFIDKVVQIALHNILKQIYFKCFIHDSYGSIDNKGTHKCVDRIQHFMRKAKWLWGNDAYIISLDIKKFFYSIDRNILKNIYKKKIGCKRTLDLLFNIIDSANQIDELGLPLGNTMSQLSSNVYMNELDQYAKRKLGLKFYVRYMDDIVVVVKNKEEAKKIKCMLEDFIENKLNLEINKDKTKIFPIKQGINTIGFKIYTTHRKLRNQTKKNIKRKTKKIKNSLEERRMSVIKAEQILNSWLGHSRHGSSYNFIQNLLNRHDYLAMTDKGFKINTNKLRMEGNQYDIF